jgi:hypothetical protein
MKSKQMSYFDLVIESRSVPDTMTYLTRFVMNHNGPSPKVRDFRAYLEFINFPSEFERPLYFAESLVVRRFKN